MSRGRGYNRGLTRHRGLALALVASVAIFALQRALGPDVRYDRVVLPAFDGHVYAAMGERPDVFTVAPWGYRVLTAWLVHLLPFRSVVPAYEAVTTAGLALAGVLLYLYLRRLGSGEWAALLGVAVFCLTRPVGDALSYQFLVEPVAVVLELALLLALQAGAPVAVLALLATLGALSKEFLVLLLPLVYLMRRRHEGDRRALLSAAVAAAPALAATAILRLWWTPYLEVHAASGDLLAVAFARLCDHGAALVGPALLGGLILVALAGALRPKARDLRLPAAYLFLATVVPPFFNPADFSPQDVPRLLVYALPAILPLALVALDAIVPHLGAPAPASPPPPRSVSRSAIALTGLALLFPFACFDTYRRVDMRGLWDAHLVLATCRGTLATAERLEQGATVSYSLAPSGPRELYAGLQPSGGLRWYLRDGWSPDMRTGSGDVRLVGTHASILLPCFSTADLEVTLDMDAEAPVRLDARVNGHPVGAARALAESTRSRLVVPEGALFRGDNVLTLAPNAAVRPRLLALSLRFAR